MMGEYVEGPFKRVPTDAEKIRYRTQWGGYSAARMMTFGMGMFVIGLLLGLAL